MTYARQIVYCATLCVNYATFLIIAYVFFWVRISNVKAEVVNRTVAGLRGLVNIHTLALFLLWGFGKLPLRRLSFRRMGALVRNIVPKRGG